jgi:hypothetical protein
MAYEHVQLSQFSAFVACVDGGISVAEVQAVYDGLRCEDSRLAVSVFRAAFVDVGEIFADEIAAALDDSCEVRRRTPLMRHMHCNACAAVCMQVRLVDKCGTQHGHAHVNVTHYAYLFALNVACALPACYSSPHGLSAL